MGGVRAQGEERAVSAENLVGLLAGAALLVYVLVALVLPERF